MILGTSKIPSLGCCGLAEELLSTKMALPHLGRVQLALQQQRRYQREVSSVKSQPVFVQCLGHLLL